MKSAAQPAFRRATRADALALAREVFLADQRVDMNALAGQLGVSRATMHRWVHTREELLGEVCAQLAGEYFEAGLVHARQHPDDAVPALVHAIVSATSGLPPLRGFVQREPELALRLVLGDGAVRERAVTGVEAFVQEIFPEEADQLADFSEAVVDVTLALEWATVAAGREPSADRIARIIRSLLAGARAGELRES